MPIKCLEFKILYSSYTQTSIRPCVSWLLHTEPWGLWWTDLPSSVDNLGQVFLALVPDRLAECVLNCGIVAVDKVAVDELDRQG
jgi:hypothetical protein